MEMQTVKVAELWGAALDWAVAQVVEQSVEAVDPYAVWTPNFDDPRAEIYNPSENWEWGGPLIESQQIFLDAPQSVHKNFGYDEKLGRCRGEWEERNYWAATVSARVRKTPPRLEGFPGGVGRGQGDTPLLAICRAIVASKYDLEVDVPRVLLQK